MGKVTFVVEFLDGQEAEINFGTNILGGRLLGFAFRDFRDDQERLEELENVLDGLPQEAIDGGWTAKGISRYVKSLEATIAHRNEAPPFAYVNKFSGQMVYPEQQPNAATDKAVYAPLFIFEE